LLYEEAISVTKAERNENSASNLPEKQKIGELIRRKRKQLGLTLLALQSETGIDNGNLSRIERGDQALSNRTRGLLARALDLPIGLLTEHAASGVASASLFAEEMRTHRTSRGITLVEVHEMTGIEPYTLLKFERAEMYPTDQEVRLISLALGLASVPRPAGGGALLAPA
jgi:transcriptional regulator with XRE-family HTH domain